MSSTVKSAAHIEIVRECLRRFKSVRIRVTGSSMIPAIWPGDVLQVESVRTDRLSAGDVILFRRGSRLFAHRLLTAPSNSGREAMNTKGDALPSPDPPISARDILGRVESIVSAGNRGKRITPASPNRALALAIASCDFIPAGMMRFRRFARLIRSRRPL